MWWSGGPGGVYELQQQPGFSSLMELKLVCMCEPPAMIEAEQRSFVANQTVLIISCVSRAFNLSFFFLLSKQLVSSPSYQGGVIFEEVKKRELAIWHFVPHCFKTPIPKFHFLMLLKSWGSTSANCGCYSIISNNKKRFVNLRQGVISSLIFLLKLKMYKNSTFFFTFQLR